MFFLFLFMIASRHISLPSRRFRPRQECFSYSQFFAAYKVYYCSLLKAKRASRESKFGLGLRQRHEVIIPLLLEVLNFKGFYSIFLIFSIFISLTLLIIIIGRDHTQRAIT
jgi:hypothetical protein